MRQLQTIVLLSLFSAVILGCQSPAAQVLKPVPEGKALWSGSWTSHEYTHVRGNVAVILPADLPKEGAFTVPAAIYYKMFTFYRAGNTVEMELEGETSTDGRSVGNNADDPIMAPGLRLELFSKGGFGPTNQVINYEAVFDPNGNLIEGSYKSSHPFDRGTFRLQRTHSR